MAGGGAYHFNGLSALCGLAALTSIGVYIYVVLRRQRWLNSVGLLLTGLGTLALAQLLPPAPTGGALINAAFAVALFISALVAQIFAAIRGRTAWDGVDRRGTP